MTADTYRRALDVAGIRAAESSPAFANELELQARWFAGEFGREGVGVDGRRIVIEDFGRWNREAGPDFVDARVRIGDEERRGAIELDFDVRDWERHGHMGNPAYRETILHVFIEQPAARFFTRTCDHREVAQWRLVLPANPVPARGVRPELVTADPDQARAVLAAAARHRLDLKGAALQRYAAVHDHDEAWFAAIAVALGYKRNQTPFLLLAQRVGRRAASEAMLFGVAGFLESPEPPKADVRGYLRGLWESWWAERARCARWILPRTAWQLAGIRPANHPHRRVAALAGVAAGWRAIRDALVAGHRDKFETALDEIDHDFWAHRFNLAAAPLRRPQALIGPERIADITLNVFFPLVVARDEAAWSRFCAERGPTPAAVMRAAAARFFGGAVDLRPAFAQQGLLQLDRDFRAAPDPEAFLDALRRERAIVAVPFPLK